MENAENKEVNKSQEQEKKPIYFQKILFGSPGTGKSYQILDKNNEKSIINQLNLKKLQKKTYKLPYKKRINSRRSSKKNANFKI